MSEEANNFIRVWILAISSTIYCYTISKTPQIPIGFPRLILILPIIFLFTTLPFTLNTINLGAPTFFYLGWLGNFKLLLFAFGLGPLISQPYNKPLSLIHFTAIALLPIKVKEVTSSSTYPKLEVQSTGRKIRKVVIFVIATIVHAQRNTFNYVVMQFVYILHLSLGIEIMLAITGVMVKALLGLELEVQFRDAFLATSLQDFWGNRWNLMTSNILRLSVYNPIRRITSPMIGKPWGAIAGLVGSFTVSGLMHELTYYYYTRVSPTWEVTLFFILQGVCTAIEAIVKREVCNKWKPHRIVSIVMTNCFVMITATWLFMPQLLRNNVDDKLLQEYAYLGKILKSAVYN